MPVPDAFRGVGSAAWVVRVANTALPSRPYFQNWVKIQKPVMKPCHSVVKQALNGTHGLEGDELSLSL